MIDGHSPPLIRVIRAHERIPSGRIVPTVGSSDLPEAWVSRLRIFGSLENGRMRGGSYGGYLRVLPILMESDAPSDSGLGSGFRHAPRTRKRPRSIAPNRDFTRAAPEWNPRSGHGERKEKILFYSRKNKASSLIRCFLKFSAKKNHSHTPVYSSIYFHFIFIILYIYILILSQFEFGKIQGNKNL